MFNQLLAKVIGSKNDRDVKKIRPILERVNALEALVKDYTDDRLKGRTAEFRDKLSSGASLDDILPDAFATVREAARRVLRMRHYDVQLVGGVVLHQGKIAEMKTGEGKTLVATLPAYLNGLTGKGVHVVTVNDYLAKRDSEWMGRVFGYLGMTVGVVHHGRDHAEKRDAYAADITYGTNNEFGFDYLRDNMERSPADMVQQPHHFAIVDEVDSILIDEARTPLIISGPTEDSTEKYYVADRVMPQLKREVDYQVDEKHRTATFTDEGNEKLEKLLGFGNLYDPEHMDLVHQLHNAVKAHTLFKRDVDYMVQDGEVVIVDEFTGRLMPGRRWSDGLHQAVEAKERVRIQRESQTYATVTFQNYFRLYEKLSGMTGTAETEAAEFHKTYKLDVTAVPTHKTLIRKEHADIIYRTEREKFNAIVRQLAALYTRGQPVLVGTISIAKSERLSELLGKARAFFAPRPQYMAEVLVLAEIVPESRYEELEGALDADRCRKIVERPQRLKELLSELDIEPSEASQRFMDILTKGKVPHVVLNAKHHEKEADIVAQAGRLGAVTIATNMAGRGTDILLGGSPEAMAREELGHEVELADYDRFKEVVEKYRGSCQEEHDEVIRRGGLFILGSERHEARRIDNQLRGRAGRQGDPGESRFYLAMEDDLMRIFGTDRVSGLMQRLGMEEDEPIEAKMVTRAIERAQKQVEAQNFSVRKHLLEYDDVMNKQRKAFYKHRSEVFDPDGQREYVHGVAGDLLDTLLARMAPAERGADDWDLDSLATAFREQYGIDIGPRIGELRENSAATLRETLYESIRKKYDRREAEFDSLQPGLLGMVERDIMLFVADQAWRDHLYALDHLKEGIGLRGYGQRDPLVEYKRESFTMFEAMWQRIDEETMRRIFLVRPPSDEAAPVAPARPVRRAELTLGGPQGTPQAQDGAPEKPKTVRAGDKVGRNAPCPCGSGKKYKRCHGA